MHNLKHAFCLFQGLHCISLMFCPVYQISHCRISCHVLYAICCHLPDAGLHDLDGIYAPHCLSQVEAEVRLLIDRLREVAGTVPFKGSAVHSRDPDGVIPKASRKEQALVNYVSTVAAAMAVSVA